ncbi:MAG: hypothetical protein U9N59_03020 [Campylobacterota bacterium]|nr:hypothetical protein [Campylobacterota bacterium]
MENKIMRDEANEFFKLKYLNRINKIITNDDLKKSEDFKQKYQTLQTLSSEIKNEHPVTKNYIKLELERMGLNYEDCKEKFNNQFPKYESFYQDYYSEERAYFFSNPVLLTAWIEEQNDTCGYCGIKTEELSIIAINRAKILGLSEGVKNLTLNGKKKRSKGKLEIERIEPSKLADSDFGYNNKNCILCCPLCNNAKSNLIDEDGWRDYFVKPMREYYKSLLNNKLKNEIPTRNK